MRGYSFSCEGVLYTWWRTIAIGSWRFTFGFRRPFRSRPGKIYCNLWRVSKAL